MFTINMANYVKKNMKLIKVNKYIIKNINPMQNIQ